MTEIFGVKLGQENKREVFSRIEGVFKNEVRPQPIWIATLNPEILLKAEKDLVFRKILNSANLKINDGFGLQLWAFLKKKKIGERLTGADLAEIILKKAIRENREIGFILNLKGFSRPEKLEECLRKKGLRSYSILAEKKGGFSRETFSLQGILSCEIILVGLGAPDQEKLIFKIIQKNLLPNLKLAIGVGGTFDFWTGEKRRAPLFWRKIGMEWLWRGVLQPNRFLRLWRATGFFLAKSLF